jgi:hypothetical protein
MEELVAKSKALLDQFGVIHEANKILPDDKHRLQLMEALAELEDNECHKKRSFPKTRLHKVAGVSQAVYRADIDKISGWRLHLQFDRESNQLHLKDVIPGKGHDDAIDVIKAKKDRYE